MTSPELVTVVVVVVVVSVGCVKKRLFLNVQFSDDIADACVGSLDVFHPR